MLKRLLPNRSYVCSLGISFIVFFTSFHQTVAQTENRTADKPKTIAGRTVAEWTTESRSENLFRRLRAIKTLASFNERSIQALTDSLTDSHPAARYWAANGLGDIGSKKLSQKAIPLLKKMLDSKLRADRMSAAYALCKLENVATALPRLTEALTHPDKGTATSAADFIARIGPPAKAAIPDLEKAQKHKDYHVKRSAKEAVRRINGISPVSVGVAGDDRREPPDERGMYSPSAEFLRIPLPKGTASSLPASAARLLPASRAAESAKNQRPNILWISCEDISANLGCYGDSYATTPNLDRLAKQGTLFRNCFGHAGVCAVNRSGIITGVYPTSIGSQHMRSRIVPPPRIKCFTEYLRASGYYCTNRSKTDYNFEPPPTAWDKSGGRHKDWQGRSKNQPFFSVINLTVSHESKIRAKYDKLHHDSTKVKLPPYIPDTPITRRDRTRYYDIVMKMDRQVGEILKRLKDDGLEENTIVIFWSDHGAGLPRAKRWLYDSGLHVPMIVRWPGKLEPGSVRHDLVCFIDFAPTVLSLAGIDPPKYMHGRSFLPREHSNRRKYIFAHRDRMDEAYDMIRAVRDRRYKYIRNFMPLRTYAQNIEYMNEMPTMKEMRRLHQVGKLKGAEKLYFRKTKQIEELYDLKNDPHEINNIAADPKFSAVLTRMRYALEEWQIETGDMGLIPEPILMEAMRPDAKYAVTKTPRIELEGDETSTLVTLSCPTKGASIAYTTHTGKNRKWQLYHKPFRVKPGTTLRTKACRLGYKDSKTVIHKIVPAPSK